MSRAASRGQHVAEGSHWSPALCPRQQRSEGLRASVLTYGSPACSDTAWSRGLYVKLRRGATNPSGSALPRTTPKHELRRLCPCCPCMVALTRPPSGVARNEIRVGSVAEETVENSSKHFQAAANIYRTQCGVCTQFGVESVQNLDPARGSVRETAAGGVPLQNPRLRTGAVLNPASWHSRTSAAEIGSTPPLGHGAGTE